MAKLELEIDFKALGEELAKHGFVEVVRCKDCRRWCICHHSDEWFCGDGERRDDGLLL